jgi:hypothetical protein
MSQGLTKFYPTGSQSENKTKRTVEVDKNTTLVVERRPLLTTVNFLDSNGQPIPVPEKIVCFKLPHDGSKKTEVESMDDTFFLPIGVDIYTICEGHRELERIESGWKMELVNDDG